MNDQYDFIVIGGGSAGYAGAAEAVRRGLSTLLVEGGPDVGGLCILRGCMPSKALLESAHRALAIREAAEFGLNASYQGADGAAIRARKRRLIDGFADYRRRELADGRFDFLRGRAHFTDAHAIAVEVAEGGTKRITGRAFLVATGSEISVPPIAGLRESGFWTSDEVLDAESIPASVCILGGGAIALELASFYHGVGVPTTLIQRSAHVLREMDEDVADALTAALERRGVEIFRETRIIRVSAGARGNCVHFEHRGGTRVVEAERIVCALGRAPALDGLMLELAGVRIDSGHIAAEATQQCGMAHLFAAGDVCGPHEVVHLAIEQGELAARNAARVLGRLDGALERMDYALKLFACFTHPEVASAGLTERDCAGQGCDVVVARYPFADHGKSLIRGATDGFVKLVAERGSRRLVGGACVGPEASELIHEIVVALRFGATARDLATTPHYHPTLGEIWTYPAAEIAES